MLVLVAAALGIVLHEFRSRSRLPVPLPVTGSLGVTFFDVGQGDSTLIQTSSGKNILVDTGPPSARRTLFLDLELSGVRHLDLLILTHADRDHSGNAEAILRHIPTAVFMDNGFDARIPAEAKLRQEVGRHTIPGITLSMGHLVGTSTDLGGGAVIHYLAPVVAFPDPNDNSIILRVSFGQVSVLLTGDAGQREIGRLLASGVDVKSTVLKIAHHGAAKSTSLPLLERVAPRAAVISCGLGNQYSHPNPEVLGTLRHRAIQIWRTDLQGTIRFRTNGTSYKFLPSVK